MCDARRGARKEVLAREIFCTIYKTLSFLFYHFHKNCQNLLFVNFEVILGKILLAYTRLASVFLQESQIPSVRLWLRPVSGES